MTLLHIKLEEKIKLHAGINVMRPKAASKQQFPCAHFQHQHATRGENILPTWKGGGHAVPLTNYLIIQIIVIKVIKLQRPSSSPRPLCRHRTRLERGEETMHSYKWSRNPGCVTGKKKSGWGGGVVPSRGFDSRDDGKSGEA